MKAKPIELKEYLEKEKLFDESLTNLLNDIPDKKIMQFMEISMNDVQTLIGSELEMHLLQNKKVMNLVHVIFRAYCVGYMLGENHAMVAQKNQESADYQLQTKA